MTTVRDPLNGNFIIQHPAFTAVKHNLHYADMEWGLEMILFLTHWSMGRREQQPFDVRCFAAQKRKTTFGYPAIDDFGLITPIGETFVEDAKIITRSLMRWFSDNARDFPDVAYAWQYEHVDQLDQIVINAVLQSKHLILLQELYLHHLEDIRDNSDNPDKKSEIARLIQKVQVPGRPQVFQFIPHSTTETGKRQYLDTSRFRNLPARRKMCEHLLRFQLMEYVALDRGELGLGQRGRPLMGGVITPGGIRFMELFLREFNVVGTYENRDHERYGVLPPHSAPSNTGIPSPTPGAVRPAQTRSAPPITIPPGAAIITEEMLNDAPATPTQPAEPSQNDLATSADALRTGVVLNVDHRGVVISVSGPGTEKLAELIKEGVMIPKAEALDLLADES